MIPLQSKKYPLLKKLAERNLNVYKSYYFTYFFALSAFLPLYPIYLNEVRQFPNDKIGIILSINPLVSILFQPLWGIINEKFNLDKKLVMFSLVMINLAVGGVIYFNQFSIIVIFTFLFGLFLSAIGPIQDGLTVQFSRKYGFKYGDVRIWGSIGYAIGSFIVGFLVSLQGYFVVIIVSTIFYVLSLFFLYKMKQLRKLKINKNIYKQNNIIALFKNKSFLFFILFSSFSIGIINASGNFMFIKMSREGANASQIGIINSILVFAEIIIMIFVLKFNHKVKDINLIVISVLIQIPSFIIFIFSNHLYFLMFSMILRGIYQGLFIPVILSFINSIVPNNQMSTGIILYSAVSIGLIGYLTTFLGGYISEYTSLETLFTINLGIILVSFVFAFILKKTLRLNTNTF